MISISIIGHNEEKNIERCLKSLSWANEIIFVDCESTDKTVDIVKKYTSKIFYKDNNPNLNVNKQFGIEQCSSDWILYIDPDEIITEELRDEILSKIQKSNEIINGYFIPRKNYYFGKFLKFGGKYPDYQLRLFKKGFAKFPCENVHERICVDGKVSKLKSAMIHYPFSDISDMSTKSDFYSTRRAEQLFKLNKKPGLMFVKNSTKFLKNYIFKLGFLDGFTGLKVAIMDSHNEYISIVKLKEMKNEKK